ncbi:MAG: hypothetical protein Q9M09_00865, partial [Mariprofundaceae bacterium]|nr:hypothetical protein [Mariprofundaceae bacterium]
FIVHCFRDSERETPHGEGLFISPADGKVIRAKVRDHHLKVDIFMNIFNVHVNRAAMDRVISDMTYTRGQLSNVGGHVSTGCTALTQRKEHPDA